MLRPVEFRMGDPQHRASSAGRAAPSTSARGGTYHAKGGSSRNNDRVGATNFVGRPSTTTPLSGITLSHLRLRRPPISLGTRPRVLWGAGWR